MDLKKSKRYESWVIKLNDYKTYFETPECRFALDNKMDIYLLCTNFQKYTRMMDWISRNIKNYKNEQSIMANNDIRSEWERFMFDPKYYDIFKYDISDSQYNIDKWKYEFEIFLKCDDTIEHTSKNNVEKISWIIKNNDLFIERKDIMQDTEIFNIWQDFINKNSKLVHECYVENENRRKNVMIEFVNEQNSRNNVILNKLEIFRGYLENLEERAITSFSIEQAFFIDELNEYLYNDKNLLISNRWLDIVNHEDYKKFCLNSIDNFYFNFIFLKIS